MLLFGKLFKSFLNLTIYFCSYQDVIPINIINEDNTLGNLHSKALCYSAWGHLLPYLHHHKHAPIIGNIDLIPSFPIFVVPRSFRRIFVNILENHPMISSHPMA